MSFRLLAKRAQHTFQVDLAVTPITTAAWLQLLASAPKACTAIEIYNPSGSTIKISTGAAGLEDASVVPYTILPGGSSILLPHEISKGTRISAKALDSNATTNLFVMNFFG